MEICTFSSPKRSCLQLPAKNIGHFLFGKVFYFYLAVKDKKILLLFQEDPLRLFSNAIIVAYSSFLIILVQVANFLGPHKSSLALSFTLNT